MIYPRTPELIEPVEGTAIKHWHELFVGVQTSPVAPVCGFVQGCLIPSTYARSTLTSPVNCPNFFLHSFSQYACWFDTVVQTVPGAQEFTYALGGLPVLYCA